jgi:hypothetical protein
MIRKLLNWDNSISSRDTFFSSIISFCPYLSRRVVASCSVSPSVEVPSDSRTDLISCA